MIAACRGPAGQGGNYPAIDGWPMPGFGPEDTGSGSAAIRHRSLLKGLG